MVGLYMLTMLATSRSRTLTLQTVKPRCAALTGVEAAVSASFLSLLALLAALRLTPLLARFCSTEALCPWATAAMSR